MKLFEPVRRLLTATLLLLSAILTRGAAFADPATTPQQHTSQAKRIDPAQLTGKIKTIDKVRILTLWGTPEQRGFAHGYLLAEDIVNLLDGYLRHSVKDPAAFEKQAKMLLKVMTILPR